MWKHFSDWVSIYMQITWEKENVWRKHRKEGKAGENTGERGCQEKKHGRDGMFKENIRERVCKQKT